MTATAVVLELPPRVATPRRIVTSLARIEALRIVRHPAFLLALLGTLYTLTQERGADVQQLWMLNGQAFVTLGVGTFLAAFLNASRVHRDRAEELYAALPTGAGHVAPARSCCRCSPRPASRPSWPRAPGCSRSARTGAS